MSERVIEAVYGETLQGVVAQRLKTAEIMLGFADVEALHKPEQTALPATHRMIAHNDLTIASNLLTLYKRELGDAHQHLLDQHHVLTNRLNTITKEN